MSEAILKEKEWILVKYAHAIVHPLGTVSILLGLIILAGYFGNIETLYRPITNGPATNPLTAICMIFIGFVLRMKHKKKQGEWLRRVFSMLVVIISLVRGFDMISGSNISAFITPFHDQVIRDLQFGKPNAMGMNSAIMFFGISVSLLLYSFHKVNSSQFIAFIAAAIPTISFTGYIYNLENFYGHMSIMTTTIGFILSFSTLCMTAHIGGLKAILSPHVGGKVARFQTIAGYAFPTILGYFLVKIYSLDEGNLFGFYVVTICWFIIVMVSISAIFQEKIDYERRNVEYLLEKAAMNDPLTGLANRRKFLEFGEEAINRVQRNKSQFCLLILDIDYFKKINDIAGHDMGDLVLVKLGNTLKNSVRNVDLVSRIGGEEFSIILADMNKQDAIKVAEKIRMNIEKINIEGWTDIHGPITVSIGCASNDGHCTLKQTFVLADNAMYKAKEKGRNQIIFADNNECCPV